MSYEIHETSLWRVSKIPYEMTTSVRFCLSDDYLKWDFIAFKVDIISIENITVFMDGIMTLRASKQVLCNVWS